MMIHVQLEVMLFFLYWDISKVLWPTSAPDLTPPYFFIWELLKRMIFTNKPPTIDDLKGNIRYKIAAILADVGASRRVLHGRQG
jgi:hypothetical protein